MRVLGVMSGTSLDGADFAICDVTRSRIRLVRTWTTRFSTGLRERIHLAARHVSNTAELARLHHDLGRFYAAGARRGLNGDRCDLVGLHGQTVFHQASGTHPATLQIGESAHLVEVLRCPVVSNFRAADLAAGGQGAPLATAFHKQVFGRPGQCIAVNNLGGISNVTVIDGRNPSVEPVVLAFDTGPANLPLDTAVFQLSRGKRRFDRDGKWAASGRVHPKLVAAWLRHPFFKKRPPKSTGREEFGEAFLNRIAPDIARNS